MITEKTEAAMKEIAKIVTFECEELSSPVIVDGFCASLEHNEDWTFYVYVDNWGDFSPFQYDNSDHEDRRHAISVLRSIADRLSLRVIGGIQ